MRVDVISTAELGPSEVSAWRAIQSAEPAFADPFHTPDWARIVGDARGDARVGVISDAGATVGFLAIQRQSPFTAMGLGAPINDGDGVVAYSDVQIDLAALPQAFGVDRIDFGHLPLDSGRYEQVARVSDSVMTADLEAWPAFLAARKAEGSSTLRNLEKKRRKLGREVGEVVFTGPGRDPEALAAMFHWKELQLRRTHQPNILARAWCREVHERVAAADAPEFAGEVFAVRAGGRLAAALLALRSETVLHAWMIAHDPAFASYSPGAMVWHHMFEASHAAGVRLIDFGCGDYPYKRFYANGARRIGCGFIGRPSLSTAVRGGMFAARSLMEQSRSQLLAGLPGRVMRRLDVQRALSVPAH